MDQKEHRKALLGYLSDERVEVVGVHARHEDGRTLLDARHEMPVMGERIELVITVQERGC